MPEISVILPVYNGQDYLAEAIESIISQTFHSWELIIINDGSTDKSEEIIKSYLPKESRIKYYRNQQNSGLIFTLNKAIDLSEGNYIARMDADDICSPERLQIQYDFLRKNTDIALCGTYATVINNNGKPIGRLLNLRTDEYIRIHLLFSVPLIHSSVMGKAEVFKQNHYDTDYKHAEDYDLWCRISANHKIANIPSYLLKYRWHSTNVSVLNQKIQEKTKERVIRRQLTFLGLFPSDQEMNLHLVSFRQRDIKSRGEKKTFSDFVGLSQWFGQIIEANNNKKLYHTDALQAYLWSRWIVVCIAQKKYGKIFKPDFVDYNLNVLVRTLQLILFYSKK